MPREPSPLRLVPPPGDDAPAPGTASPGDLGLLAFILAVSLVPIVGLAAGGPSWGHGAAGLGTAAALLAGRALARGLGERSRPPP